MSFVAVRGLACTLVELVVGQMGDPVRVANRVVQQKDAQDVDPPHEEACIRKDSRRCGLSL